jgi:hypothetical protein
MKEFNLKDNKNIFGGNAIVQKVKELKKNGVNGLKNFQIKQTLKSYLKRPNQ